MIFLIICLVIIIALMVYHKQSTHKAAPTDKAITTVTVQTFSKTTAPLTVTAYGTTVSLQSVIVSAKTSGTIQRILFKAGDTVKQGQQLFNIQSSDTDNQMAKLNAALEANKAKYLSYQQANQETPGTVAQVDVDSAKADYLAAKSAYAATKAETLITAPVDGTASDTNLAIGSTVSEGDPLVTISNLQSLQVKYSLPGKYQQQAATSQAITFTPNDQKKLFKGTVAYVSPGLDTNNNVILRANFNQKNQLSTNVFGQVTQTIDPNQQAFTLPQTLVQTDSGGFYVYIVKDNKVTQQYVDTGRISQQGNVTITKGITDKTPVIVSNLTTLSPGQTVATQEKEP